MESLGEKTELWMTPAVGVAGPDAPGVAVEKELVEANRLDKDELVRRYGSVSDDREDLAPARRAFASGRLVVSESVCCGDCRASSGEEVMSAANVPSEDASWT